MNPKGLGPAIIIASIFIAVVLIGGSALCLVVALGRHW